MKSSLLTLLVSLVLAGVHSLTAHQNDRAAHWRRDLGSADFALRQAAMQEIWQSGNAAVPFLESLRENTDPELAARADSLLQKLALGITPETPPELVKILEDYVTGDRNERMQALRQLMSQEQFHGFLKVYRIEKSDEVRESALRFLMPKMNRLVRVSLHQDRIDDAIFALSLSETYEHQIWLGHILNLSGKLEPELARLANSTKVQDRERYLNLLRTAGDPVRLQREAERLGDRELAILATMAQGDHRPYFRFLSENQNLARPFRDYLKWILADEHGDRKLADQALSSLRSDLHRPEHSSAALLALFLAGEPKMAFDEDPELSLEEWIDYNLGLERPVQVAKLQGFESPVQIDKWLLLHLPEARTEAENGEWGEACDRLFTASNFLSARGLVAEASHIACALFDLRRMVKGEERMDWSHFFRYLDGRVIAEAMGREVKEHEAVPTDFLNEMDGSGHFSWVFETLRAQNPELSLEHAVLLTLSFSQTALVVSEEEFERAFQTVLDAATRDKAAKARLARLYDQALIRNRASHLRLILDAQAKAGEDVAYQQARLALSEGRLADSLAHLRDIEVDPSAVNAPFLYQIALIEKSLDEDGWEDRLKKAELAGPGSARALRVLSHLHLRESDFARAVELDQRAILRLPSLPRPFSNDSQSSLFVQAAANAASLHDWKRAHGFREIAALFNDPDRGMRGGAIAVRERFSALVARGAARAQASQRGGAEADFVKAHQLIPHDGSLANELFPVIRELGFIELHDRLFAESAELARALIRQFPKDHNLYNNFAWLASRANRCLDEAEGYLKQALEMQPQSAAYLDTMGEIYFARGNREEALKWGQRSLQNAILGSSGSRWELHQQNRRFREGEFPAK